MHVVDSHHFHCLSSHAINRGLFDHICGPQENRSLNLVTIDADVFYALEGTSEAVSHFEANITPSTSCATFFAAASST